MEEKKKGKTGLLAVLLVLAIIAIVFIGYLVYGLYNEKIAAAEKVEILTNKVSKLENTISNLQSSTDTNSNAAIPANTNTAENSQVLYVTVEIESKEEGKPSQGIEYASRKITDKQKIDSLMKVIDSATEYKPKTFIPDFGDVPPVATIYLANGQKYTVAAGDEMNDGGTLVNLMTKWTSEDGSNKTIYKVDAKLGELIAKLFGE